MTDARLRSTKMAAFSAINFFRLEESEIFYNVTYVFLTENIPLGYALSNLQSGWYINRNEYNTDVHKFTMTSSNGNIFSITGHLCGEFTGNRWIPAQRSVTRSFNVYCYLRLNKRLSKQKWGLWFETPSRPLFRHCNAIHRLLYNTMKVVPL